MSKQLSETQQRERLVLDALGECSEDYCIGFNAISSRTSLPRNLVRRAARSLARKGLARYERGLWSEYTDKPAGAGYGITRAGRALLDAEHPLERDAPEPIPLVRNAA